MQRKLRMFLTIGLLWNAAAFAQSQSGESLGDIARANRAKEQAQEASGAAPKVITNQDLPANSSAGIPEPSAADPMTQVSGVQRSNHYTDQRLNQRLVAEQRTGDLWRGRIQAQENRVADLEARIDRLNSSIHATVGTAQYDAPVNRYQAIQSERLAQMQAVLDQEQRRLAAMQDAARHAGMGQ